MKSRYDTVHDRYYVLVTDVEDGTILIADSGWTPPDDVNAVPDFEEGEELIVKSDPGCYNFYVEGKSGAKVYLLELWEVDELTQENFFYGLYLKENNEVV